MSDKQKMPDYADLIKRLHRFLDYGPHPATHNQCVADAINTIATLTAERDELRTILDGYEGCLEGIALKREREKYAALVKAVVKYKNEVNTACDRYDDGELDASHIHAIDKQLWNLDRLLDEQRKPSPNSRSRTMSDEQKMPDDKMVVSKAEIARMEKTNVMLQENIATLTADLAAAEQKYAALVEAVERTNQEGEAGGCNCCSADLLNGEEHAADCAFTLAQQDQPEGGGE